MGIINNNAAAEMSNDNNEEQAAIAMFRMSREGCQVREAMQKPDEIATVALQPRMAWPS